MSTNSIENEYVESRDLSMEKESSQRAIRAGAIAAFVSAGLTTLAIVIIPAISAPGESALSHTVSPWNLVDAGILAVLGILVLRRSRIAATLLMMYFVADTFMLWTAAGEPVGVFIRVIFFSLYFGALRGTYRWHRLQRQAPAAAAQC